MDPRNMDNALRYPKGFGDALFRMECFPAKGQWLYSTFVEGACQPYGALITNSGRIY